jgi:hypothetical protein
VMKIMPVESMMILKGPSSPRGDPKLCSNTPPGEYSYTREAS